jgi:hypothetical protein
MGNGPCGENGTCRRQESHCKEGGGEKGSSEGGKEGSAGQEIGGEEGGGEEDCPDCCTGHNGNWRSVTAGARA